MKTQLQVNLVVVTALLMSFSSTAESATLQINGIAPFNTSLGTLTNVTVSIDPFPTQTSSHQTISSIPSHAHLSQPNPLPVPGLGSFLFSTSPTSTNNSSAFGSHSHSVNNTAAIKNFSGAGLVWFLNANPPINSVVIPPFPTQNNQGHTHTVNYAPVVPITTFTYNPIPEPATATLMMLGLAGLSVRRGS